MTNITIDFTASAAGTATNTAESVVSTTNGISLAPQTNAADVVIQGGGENLQAIRGLAERVGALMAG